MIRLRPALLAGTAALALLVAGCGTTEDPVDAGGATTASEDTAGSADTVVSENPGSGTASNDAVSSDAVSSDAVSSEAASSEAAAASASTAGGGTSGPAAGPVTITDGAGRTVTLDQPATRVVALEWGEAETLVSLGVMPVGVADVQGYATWDVAEKLDSSVKDVGTRGEPSIDAIVALEPDLVVMSGAGGAEHADQLAGTVPVLVTTSSDASRQLDRLRDDVHLLAEATGTQDEAEQLLSHMDTAIADGKKAIEDAGAAGSPFLMADGWMEGSTVAIRMFAKGSQMSDIAEAIGLKNAWTQPGDEQWGLGQTDVEGLAGMTEKDLRLFYSASEDDVFAEGLSENPIWTSLPFVQNHQLTKLDKGTWTFGGPASVEFVIDQLVAAYSD